MRLFCLRTFVRFETMVWPSIRFVISLQIFKKPLDIFSPQIERTRSKEFLVIILAVKEALSDFLASSLSLKKANTVKPAYLSSWMRIVVSVYVWPNYISFYWLVVVSLVILIAVPIVFSRSVNNASRSTTQNAVR